MTHRQLFNVLAIGFLALTAACSPAAPDYEPDFAPRTSEVPEYSFAVHPLHNPALLLKTYEPLIEYLNSTVEGARFRLVASRDYDAYGRRLEAKEFDFALPNPYQAVRASRRGYRIFGKVGGDQNFRGVILVRRDSGIRTLTQLRGRKIGYPARTAVAGAMLPQYFLHTSGVPFNSTRAVYVGSMESAIESVRSGATAAAAVWPDPWEKYLRSHPDQARELEARWTTPSLVNNALLVHEGIPPKVADRVLSALRRLSTTESGRRLLANLSIAGFDPADDATYEPVRQFIRNFSREVRPLPPIDGGKG